MGYSIAHIEEVEPSGPGGSVRFVRRVLGAEAFGINWFDIPAGLEGFEHDEAESGQEEVSVVVAGSGKWRIDGEDVPVSMGTFLRFDPETTRCPIAGPDGLSFVAVGCPARVVHPARPVLAQSRPRNCWRSLDRLSDRIYTQSVDLCQNRRSPVISKEPE